MSNGSSGEKTEQPTPKKIRDARKKGQVFQSRDLSSVFLFVTGFGVLFVTLPRVGQRVVGLMHSSFGWLSSGTGDITSLGSLSEQAFSTFMHVTLPLFVALFLVSIASGFLQVGPLLTFEPLKAKLQKLDPIKGLKRMFSPRSFVELAKSVVKIAGAGFLTYWTIEDYVRPIVRAGTVSPLRAAHVAGTAISVAAVRLAFLFLALGVFDFFFQRWQYYKELRMTKYEVKKEYKEQEGDPMLKGKRQQVHQEILTHGMVENVRKAKVVIINPTHIAVALRYDDEEDAAPQISAKGQGVMAARIIEVARQSGVPILRRIDLAHTLYRCELGDEIPEELYEAVAAVLYELGQE